ncbi:sigma-54-dependent Fis family transcriptional regulator [Curvibacter gracilis]|uniref:sigma-54-dependent Fis family transcriptional regulator n=1 Tax=Curvibacter gracilis TaxID=230310 RepID=UPI0004B2BD0A|nr:sigma-54-dependent Fis family transcriptional regulator [Curvibacter gracilis]
MKPLVPHELHSFAPVRATMNSDLATVAEPHESVIRDSHDRCLELGLNPRDHIDYSMETLADFKLAQERCARLQAQALPVMEMLLEQVSGTGNIVCLADDKGTILMSAGHSGSVDFAERVALRPGVSWSEAAKGTNAVGTALVTERDIFVHANEHYIQSNHVLTCSASPIMDHSGGVIGVLDVTGEHYSFHPHTMALVRVAARTIENYWFCDNFSRNLRLHFHFRPELIGTMVEGVIALSADGKILGVNRAGLQLLGTSSAAARIQGVRVVFGMDFGALMDRLRSHSMAPLQMRLPDGRMLYARAQCNDASLGQHFHFGQTRASEARAHATPASPAPEPPATPTSTRAATAARHAPDLNELARGDARLAQVVDQVRRVLDRDIPILILGETGTGKEVLASALHGASQRKDQAFVAVNCASIPETLIESELFGYEEGAFTGAKRRGSAGKLLQAHGGTLFLDEIGDMPLSLQARLLRVLQERKVVPLGGQKANDVDINLVCATHRNLREMIERGEFREDLYYRINGLAVRLPRLCERTDLRVVCRRLISQLSPQHPLGISEELLAEFEAYAWPGNLRQLHNVLRTACVMAGTDREITRVHLPMDFLEDLSSARGQRQTGQGAQSGQAAGATPTLPPQSAGGDTASLGDVLHELKLSTIRQTLAACNGNVTEAAKRLNISRNTIYRKLKAVGDRPA